MIFNILNNHELQNDFRLAPDKTGIEREMLANYQLKIPDFYISILTVKKLVLKIIHLILELNQSQRLKPYVQLNIKKNRKRKNGDKYGKAFTN